MISLKHLLISFSYFFSILLLINISSLFVFWILIEINIIIFILIIEAGSEEITTQILFYFFVQTFGRVLFLLGLLSGESTNQLAGNTILSSAVGVKMGLIPFHQWIYKIYRQIGKFRFVLLITAQKLPLFFLITNCEIETSFAIVSLRTIGGSILVIKSSSIEEILLSSSIYITLWWWLRTKFSIRIFLCMYRAYLVTVIIILEILSKKNSEGIPSSNIKILTMMTTVIFVIGLPPIRFFFFKILVVNQAIKSLPATIVVLLWIRRFLSTIGYLKIFMRILRKEERKPRKALFSLRKAKLIILTLVLLSFYLLMS